MSDPTPSIIVAVDATNPGQFFACCGLLELADRLWPGAEGWFAEGDREFKIACGGTLGELLATLIMDPPNVVERLESGRLEIAPIIAPLAFSFDGGSTTAFVLDAWTRIALVKGVARVISNPPWNFWSGQQTSARIWEALRQELAAQMARMNVTPSRDLFSHRLLQGGRYGFDSGPAWNALDVGFSPNEQNLEVEASPVTELLAAVGLQRFRPAMCDDRDRFDYFAWRSPSPPLVAAAMVVANWDRRALCYRASVTTRGQYAALGPAYLVDAGVTDE
jgi:CRISPR-associated protein Csx14